MKSNVKFDRNLIGCFAEVVGARNKNLIGISGKISDESYNLIEIDTKKLQKDQVVLRIKENNNDFIIDGKIILGRPEDRLK